MVQIYTFHLYSSSFTTLAGFPLTITRSPTSFITTLPAATMLPGPTFTPGAINAPAATQLPSLIVIALVRNENAGDEKSCDPVHKNARCEMQQFDSIVTCARLRIITSSPIHT